MYVCAFMDDIRSLISMLIFYRARRDHAKFTANYLLPIPFYIFFLAIFSSVWYSLFAVYCVFVRLDRVSVRFALHDSLLEDVFTGMIDANEPSREEIFRLNDFHFQRGHL